MLPGRDGRLELVRPDHPAWQRPGDQLDALGDLVGAPPGAVLLGHRHQLTVRADPCRSAGVGEQHQRQQSGDLGVLGHQPAHQPGQPDRLGGQVGAQQPGPGGAGVPLREDQVEHVQHGGEPVGALRAGGRREPQPTVTDPLLAPTDPPGHRRLRHQERARHLGGAQPAHRPQGERDLRRRRQRRVAAQEQQDERVVGVRRRTVGGGGAPLLRQHPPGHRVLPPHPGLLATQQVGQPTGRHGDQPATRIVRYAVARPTVRGGDQRLLHRVLGRVEVPVATDQRAEDLRRQLAQQILGGSLRHRVSRPGPRHRRAPAARPRTHRGRPGRPGRRRSRWPGRSWRTPRWCNRRGPPASPGTGRR
ncbi:hypothetical protein ONO86_01495 [Micromonospora noduli]|nr:hypothetical protein ONO86_01495 [Micromonospora noduli]